MDTVEELRYPFLSVFEFFADGYWMQASGLHLFFGWIGLLILSTIILTRESSLAIKFTTIYFAAFIFNNYAYSIENIRFSEFFGIVAAFLSLKSSRKNNLHQSIIGYSLLLTAFIALMHVILIKIIYPSLDNEIEQFLVRIVLVARIIVLGLVAINFKKEFDTSLKINRLIKDVVFFGVLGIVIYFIQMVVLLTGTVPFGTFLDAGFTGFPAFGSVSIERGHFAKLFVPLFPFYAMLLITERKIFIFSIYLIVNLINFSASGQFFLMCYLVLFAFYFKKSLFKWYTYFAMLIISSFLSVVLINTFSEQILGIVNKINRLGLQGDNEGGRGLDTLMQYIETYPLGISYGGSTLRIANNLPEINLGLYAFISQFSFLSIPLIIGFTLLNLTIIKRSNKLPDKRIRDSLVIGILVSGIIYFVDILWFTPTIWLPLIVCDALSNASQKESLNV
jgi:hypothetical protein